MESAKLHHTMIHQLKEERAGAQSPVPKIALPLPSSGQDTLSSAAADQDVQYVGTFRTIGGKLVEVGTVVGGALVKAGSTILHLLRGPEDSSDDEDELVSVSSPIKQEPAKTPEVVLPKDLFERVIEKVSPKQKIKLSKNADLTYLDQLTAWYVSFMKGRDLRSASALTKEERAIQFAADSLSQFLSRIKAEPVE